MSTSGTSGTSGTSRSISGISRSTSGISRSTSGIEKLGSSILVISGISIDGISINSISGKVMSILSGSTISKLPKSPLKSPGLNCKLSKGTPRSRLRSMPSKPGSFVMSSKPHPLSQRALPASSTVGKL